MTDPIDRMLDLMVEMSWLQFVFETNYVDAGGTRIDAFVASYKECPAVMAKSAAILQIRSEIL